MIHQAEKWTAILGELPLWLRWLSFTSGRSRLRTHWTGRAAGEIGGATNLILGLWVQLLKTGSCLFLFLSFVVHAFIFLGDLWVVSGFSPPRFATWLRNSPVARLRHMVETTDLLWPEGLLEAQGHLIQQRHTSALWQWGTYIWRQKFTMENHGQEK